MLPTWCKLAYSSHEIINKKNRKRIYELRDNEKGTWLPLEPDTLKSCFDKAKDYVEIYSKSIIEDAITNIQKKVVSTEGNIIQFNIKKLQK